MKQLRVLSVMAHQDDFEFEAAGLFLRLRQHYGNDVALKIVTTSCGGSGHHEMSYDETVRRREAEARTSAALVGAEYENLRQLDGTHVPAQVFCDRNLLGGLWNCIRDFGPDYVITPPVVTDPLAGIHIDHQHTAEALRYIAYQLGVPNAYPTMNAPRQLRFRVPIFLCCLDAYSQENIWHFQVNVNQVKKDKLKMLRCHVSQIEEWLPFIDSLNDPEGAIYERGPNGENLRWSEEKWLAEKEKQFHNRNLLCGYDDHVAREYFAITKWGTTSTTGGLTAKESIIRDFPFSEWR